MISGADREEWLNRITEPEQPTECHLCGSSLLVSPGGAPGEEGEPILLKPHECLVCQVPSPQPQTTKASGTPISSTCCHAGLVFVHSHYQCERCGRVEHGCCDGAPTD